MNCPQCSTENPEGARFCLSCGATLALACPQCTTELPPDARFCFACGLRLDPRPAPSPEPTPEDLALRLQRLVPKEFAERLLATHGQVGRERRTVTILFSDIKGSTALAEHLDPEDVMEIMDGAFDVLIEPVYRYEGTLARPGSPARGRTAWRRMGRAGAHCHQWPIHPGLVAARRVDGSRAVPALPWAFQGQCDPC